MKKNPAITAAVFPDGEPAERNTTALARTKEAHNAHAPVHSSYGVTRREAFIARVSKRRAKAKAKKQMAKRSRR